MPYVISLSNVPNGAYTEMYICGPSNGDGSPDQARREFATREEAEQVIREFEAARTARPADFEPGMTATIVAA